MGNLMTEAPEQVGTGHQVYMELEEEYPAGSNDWLGTAATYAVGMPFRCTREQGRWLLEQLHLVGEQLIGQNATPQPYLVGSIVLDENGYLTFLQFDAANLNPEVEWVMIAGRWKAFRYGRSGEEPLITAEERNRMPERATLDLAWKFRFEEE